MNVGQEFQIGNFRGKREWFGYRFTAFAKAEGGKEYGFSLLWFMGENAGRIEGPWTVGGTGKGAENVPLPVVYYALNEIKGLFEVMNGVAEDLDSTGDLSDEEPAP